MLNKHTHPGTTASRVAHHLLDWIVKVTSAVAVSALLTACASLHTESPAPGETLWVPDAGVMSVNTTDASNLDDLAKYAPAFVVEDDWASWNRPGTATIVRDHEGNDRVVVDPTSASQYAETRSFVSANGRSLTNYIYRLHFDRVPVRFIPFHITAGPNGGIMVVVTASEDGDPLLYTLVHSCGCYIAFIPTDALPPELRPADWPSDTQEVFDITLPAQVQNSPNRMLVRVAGGEHRMIGLEPLTADTSDWMPHSLRVRPMASLDALPSPDSSDDNNPQSFFINEGRGAGWVRDTNKPFERLLISWWSFDWRVGVDKRYSQPHDDASPSFYTSLKPWARNASDMRYFDRFLNYWGWRL